MKASCTTLFLLILLAYPPYLFAQSLFSISCKTIHDIRIINKDGRWLTRIQLTPKAGRLLYQTTQAHPDETLSIRGKQNELSLFTPGEAIPSGKIDIRSDTEAKAIDMGRRACSDKVQAGNSPSYDDIISAPYTISYSEFEKSPLFALSCADVEYMKVEKLNLAVWLNGAKQDHVYLLFILLTDQSTERLSRLADAAYPVYFIVNKYVGHKRFIQPVTMNHQRLSLHPLLDNFEGGAIILNRMTSQAAFEAANQICPQKAPITVIPEK